MILLKIIRDDGIVLNCGDASEDFELLTKSGTATVEVESFYQEKGFGHGDIKTGQRVKGRSFSYRITTTKNVSKARQTIASFFNVLHSFTIESYMNGRALWIEADIASIKPGELLYGRAEVEVNFYAEDPFWMALTDNKRKFDASTGLWHYPYALVDLNAALPEAAYSAFEEVKINKTLNIFYDADVPSMPIIMLVGPVTNPVIHVNDAVISYAGSLLSDQTLLLDPAQSIYEKNGVNVFRYISITGDPTLMPGDNPIVSDEEQYGTIIFYKRYNGDV